ncbi:Protein NRT1/PTR FAMILY 5.5 [Abeliophyllum distichum]|uniref:Protein NRT1/PTR FAMILY 5.5 n=1 Tax=Abeliophyllum distichum TaxID=126358 RepID=A0ABD1QW77_9LAMI
MYIMMAYLTNVWKLGFTRAAAILNVFWGLVATLPLLLKFLVDTLIGHYWMLLISSISYTVGLGFLSMSTPPVLAKAMGTCSEYKPECIGNGQQILFYTGLALVVIGGCGHITSWAQFASEQINEEEEIKNGTRCCNCFGLYTVIITTIVAVIVLSYVKLWSIRFGIPAICSLVATLLFFSGSRTYKYVSPLGSPLTAFVRVFVASTTKVFYALPKDVSKLYEYENSDTEVAPHTKSLRCLDKAAIIEPSKTLEEQRKNRWRLCTVTEVEESKTIVRMIPVWLTFIFCGVVSSIGFTYFIEQLDNLNPKVGRLEFPAIVLLWFYNQAKTICNELYVYFTNSLGQSGSRKFAPAIGIVLSMISAVLCCIVAANVENRRLNVVQKHGLLDKPDETIPMTMFWLLPQFLLLAALDGLFYSSALSFFKDQSPVSIEKYLPFFIGGVYGVGILSSVLSVYIVGKISESGGKPNWFQHNLNRSRLDKYYRTLAWLSAINLVIFIVVAIFYRFKESNLQNLEAEEFIEADEPFSDDNTCCC